MLDDITMCSCEEVEPGLMKWNENCLEHGRAAQYFERERQDYRQKIKAAQQSVHLTALRRGLALSLLFNVALLAMVLVIIGGR